MTDKDKRMLYESIMKKAAKTVKSLIEEASMHFNESNDGFIQFIKRLEQVTPQEIKIAERDIRNAIHQMRLNEDATDDAIDYILSGSSKLGSDVKFERVLDTFDDLFNNPRKNFREIMMGWYAYCSGNIGDLYNFQNWQMLNGITEDDVPFIDFLVPESVSDILISDMRSLGLVERNKHETLRSFIQKEYYDLTSDAESLADKFNGWVYLRFVPMSQKNVRNIIRSNSQYIYHITDISNIESIKKNGIRLDNRSHPEVQPRIFLLVPNRNDLTRREDVRQKYDRRLFDFNECLYRALPLRIHQYRLSDGSTTIQNPYNWKFGVIQIDIDKIPTDVEFFWDVHSFPFAFFTRDSIPASAIVNCTEETIRK